MFCPTEAEERVYLEQVLEKLRYACGQMEEAIAQFTETVTDKKRYIWENQAQLDAAERAANRVSTYEEIALGEEAVRKRDMLWKLIWSPYFGRIDFREADFSDTRPFYIGIHAFADFKKGDDVVFDWRAPISSMFYDYETGPAGYDAPSGRLEGLIDLKRQYQIKNSRLDFMLESAVNIGDEILQKELSQHSDEKMKNIVATIQREQNAIIRNESAKVLVIQGAAGSGKTSIALHRVAFLLYRYKGTLTSSDVLILSPNKVFGNYISNVLPELGEETILEMSFEEMADRLLGRGFRRETFSQQVESLLAQNDPVMIARIAFKSTNEFVESLQAFLEEAAERYFVPQDVAVEGLRASKEFLAARYQALSRYPVKVRLTKMAEDLIAAYRREHDEKPETKTVRLFKEAIQGLFTFGDPYALYREFYRHLGKEEMLASPKARFLEFCDVFPLLYVKLFYEGPKKGYSVIKHLLIDEMQDYTPVQYAVVSKLFRCKMTILGDSNQSVNPYSSSSAERILPYFEGGMCMELQKSYRSTIEITALAQAIQENQKLVPIERHGEPPRILACGDEAEELAKIREMAEAFESSSYGTLGILCKSQKAANLLYKQMKDAFPKAVLLDFSSDEYQEGIVISSVHMSKGLEFDQVILPDVSAAEYYTRLDRSLLYIACTRAMHKLDLIHTGEQSAFLPRLEAGFSL